MEKSDRLGADPLSYPLKVGSRTIIVIPVRNNSDILRDTIIHALNAHDRVMVVDDGSTDGSAEHIRGLEVTLIRHPEHIGKGGAIQTAAKKAQRMGMTHIVIMDPGAMYELNDIRRFISLSEEDADAFVVGTRNFRNDNLPRSAHLSRIFSNFWLRLQTSQSLGDAGCTFRTYPLAVLEKLRLSKKSALFETEVLPRAAWAGIRLREVDISAGHLPARPKRGCFRSFGDIFLLVLLNVMLAMRAIAPLPHRKIADSKDMPGEKISVLRPIRSLKTLLTENITPGQLAAAGVLGVFLGTLPLIACHTLIILFAAGFFRLNKVAAVSASQLCMPPMVPAMCIETGYFMRHGRFLTEFSVNTLGYQASERLCEWLIGSLLLAPVLAAGVGAIIYLTATFIKRETLKPKS